jgi:hypothetical protein
MDGKISVIVATVSFGMGVDKASVRGVVHWCAPQNVAAYYQVSIFQNSFCLPNENARNFIFFLLNLGAGNRLQY